MCTNSGPSRHFVHRVADRISPEVDAAALFEQLMRSVKADGDEFGRFQASLLPHGRRLWRFEVLGQTRYAVISEDGRPVTVLPTTAGSYVRIRRKGPNQKLVFNDDPKPPPVPKWKWRKRISR